MQQNHSAASQARPVPLIFDTDMGNDIDDALALAMIHALQARGECRLLGVAVSKDNPYAPACVDLLNTFYGRGDIPIGVVRDGVTPEPGNYAPLLVNARRDDGRPLFPRTTKAMDDYAEAVAMLRRLLAAAEDRSVTVVMVGFSTNMARLLDSPADAVSHLDGRRLFERKVSRVVMMAADFSERAQSNPTFDSREYNVYMDIASARGFIADCPSPIIFSGFEVGASILYPAASIERDYRWSDSHPVAMGYRHFKRMPYDRPSWDLTAVLEAVRPERGYFGLSSPGRAEVSEDGRVRFIADANGKHRYLTVDAVQREVVRTLLVELASQPIASVSHRRHDSARPSNGQPLPRFEIDRPVRVAAE